MKKIRIYKMADCMSKYLYNGFDLSRINNLTLANSSYTDLPIPDEGQKNVENIIVNGYIMPSWVIENAKLGYIGEQIAKIYLEKNIGPVEWTSQENNRRGYDMEVGGLFFEIKTSTCKTSFEISVNEIKASQKRADMYNIFFILIDNDNNEAIGYIISNPLEKFKVSLEVLRKKISGEKVVFSPKSYSVDVGEYLQELVGVNLTDIYINLFEGKFSNNANVHNLN